MKNFSKYLAALAAVGAGLIISKRNKGVSGIGSRYTIQEIFELRKDGQFATAYNAAKQMYSNHSGHYTTLCMFWTSVDYARVLAESGQLGKARYVLQDAIEIYPKLQDVDRSAKKALDRVKDMLSSVNYYQAELPFGVSGNRMELNVTESDLREIRELMNDGFDAYVYAGIAIGFDEADVSGYGLFKEDVEYFTNLDSRVKRGTGIPTHIQKQVGQKLDGMLIMASMVFPAPTMRRVLAAINYKPTY